MSPQTKTFSPLQVVREWIAFLASHPYYRTLATIAAIVAAMWGAPGYLATASKWMQSNPVLASAALALVTVAGLLLSGLLFRIEQARAASDRKLATDQFLSEIISHRKAVEESLRALMHALYLREQLDRFEVQVAAIERAFGSIRTDAERVRAQQSLGRGFGPNMLHSLLQPLADTFALAKVSTSPLFRAILPEEVPKPIPEEVGLPEEMVLQFRMTMHRHDMVKSAIESARNELREEWQRTLASIRAPR